MSEKEQLEEVKHDLQKIREELFAIHANKQPVDHLILAEELSDIIDRLSN